MYLTSKLVFCFFLAVLTVGCGVKGPPLPALPDTPKQSDDMETAQSIRESGGRADSLGSAKDTDQDPENKKSKKSQSTY